MIPFILFIVIVVQAQEVAIKQKSGITQFWYNSSNTHVATFISPYSKILPGTDHRIRSYERTVDPMTVYVCVTNDYWGDNCDYWGAVGGTLGTQTGGISLKSPEIRKTRMGNHS